MAKNSEDATMEFMLALFKFLEKSLEDDKKVRGSKKEHKQLMKNFKKITEKGKVPPVMVSLDSKNFAYKKALDKKIKEYNKQQKAAGNKANIVHIVPLLTKDGWTYVTDKKGAARIKSLEKEILKERNVKRPEVTAYAFANDFNEKEGLKVDGITGNELNLIKQKPWTNSTFEDTLKNFSSTFTSVPLKDGSNTVIFNKTNNEKDISAKIFKDIVLSKILLSGEDGKKISDKMDNERDIMSLIKNPKKIPGEMAEVYITSATDVNDYISITKTGYTVHQTTSKNGNFIDVISKTVPVPIPTGDKKIDGIAYADYLKTCVADFKAIENPCLLKNKTECLKHCVAGNICEKGIDSKGKEIDIPVLSPEAVFRNKKKIALAEQVILIAENSFKLNGVSSPSLDQLTEKCKEVSSNIADVVENKKTVDDLMQDSLAYTTLKNNETEIKKLQLQATEIREKFTGISISSQQIMINKTKISEITSAVEVNVDKLKSNNIVIQNEMQDFSINTVTEMTDKDKLTDEIFNEKSNISNVYNEEMFKDDFDEKLSFEELDPEPDYNDDGRL